jgi:hypothetical protein
MGANGGWADTGSPRGVGGLPLGVGGLTPGPPPKPPPSRRDAWVVGRTQATHHHTQATHPQHVLPPARVMVRLPAWLLDRVLNKMAGLSTPPPSLVAASAKQD